MAPSMKAEAFGSVGSGMVAGRGGVAVARSIEEIGESGWVVWRRVRRCGSVSSG